MNYRFLLLSLTFSLLLTQCAKVSQPSGGEKDTTPPNLVRTNPPNRQLNFDKNEIELVFDEAIQINNAREQIIITPTIGKKFELEARKNRAILKLNAELLENTTYTIAFREAIQDLTERNPAVNLKLAFSTGDYIDSLSIQGKVYNLLKGTPVKNYVVAAAPYHDTLNIFKHSAQWITITNDKGEYSIENLKAGSYLLYAFEDANKNLVVDSRSEQYGFLAEPVRLDSSIHELDIPTISLDSRELKLISARPIGRYFNIRTTKGIAEYTLNNVTEHESLHTMYEDASTIRVYNTLVGFDSLQVNFQAKDSIDNTLDTLLYVRFESRTVTRDKFSIKIEHCDHLQNKNQLIATLQFSKPVLTTIPDSIFIRLDSTTFIRLSAEDMRFTTNTELTIDKKIGKDVDFTILPYTAAPQAPRQPVAREDRGPRTEQQGLLYNQLIIPAGTFLSVENDTSTQVTSPIRTFTPENSGTILIEVQTDQKVIVQLLNKSGTVQKESFQPNTRFDNLLPADYMIRVVIDLNGNAKWDPGNFFTKAAPEPVYYYRTENGLMNVNIKANWEVGPLLISPE
jgi:uncharacterized protein (DUF2141 family)